MLTRKRYGFDRSVRLTRQRDFDRVFAEGRRTKVKGLTILTAAGTADFPRLGISIGRSFGPAVARNRMKRRLREAFRRVRSELAAGDYVCVPHRRADGLSVSELMELLRKAGGHADSMVQRE